MLNMIKTSKNFPNFFENLNFYIFEKSNYLKKIQKKKLKGFSLNWISNLNNLQFNNLKIKSLIFTALQAAGLIVCLKMYLFGILRNNYYRGFRKKF